MNLEIFKEPEYIQYIKTLKKEDWSKLTDLIPEIENTTDFELPIDHTKRPDYDENTFYIPSFYDAEIVDRFREIFINLNLQLDFNWPVMDKETRIISNLDKYLDSLDLLTICKLLTEVIRCDRFCDGFLASQFQNGRVLLLLKKLKSLTTS